MAKCARRLPLDETEKGQILGILAMGCSRRVAADYVGCAVSTIRRTALRDPKFAEGLARAGQEAEIGYLGRIREAAKDPRYWRAAAWALERTNPNEFAPRKADVLTREQVRELIAEVTQILVEELPAAKYRKQVLKRLARLLGAHDRAESIHEQGAGRGEIAEKA